MSAITVGSDLVHYEVLGRGGRPVILVHSWVGSWRYWIPVMQQLHLKFRVYAVDLFGFGDSAKNPERYSHDSQVNLLREFMDQLSIRKAAMIGHGMGAVIVTDFAYRYPDRVARLLVASAPLFNVDGLRERRPPNMSVLLTTQNFNAAETIHNAELSQRKAQYTSLPNDATIARRPDKDPANFSHNQQTVANPNIGGIDRARLQEAALARAEAEMAARRAESEAQVEDSTSRGRDNLLLRRIGGLSSEALLLKCFKRSEPEYDRLLQDVAKTDENALNAMASDFDAGHLLDMLRITPTPTVVLHGTEDPIIENMLNYTYDDANDRLEPQNDVSAYIMRTSNGENPLVPLPLSGVRHFPMLEGDQFSRVIGGFLELPDITKIETKERWRRRAR
jgi:pimeloyl-ACP methyl ester carboxylesterase